MNFNKILIITHIIDKLGRSYYQYSHQFGNKEPSTHFCRWNLLIILHQNLPISDRNEYDFCYILLSYSVFIRFSILN